MAVEIPFCPTKDSSFKKTPYVLAVCQFLYRLRDEVDNNAMILPQHNETKVNKILACRMEIPDVTTEFGKNYTYDVIVTDNKVKFKMIIETTIVMKTSYMSQQTWRICPSQESTSLIIIVISPNQ